MRELSICLLDWDGEIPIPIRVSKFRGTLTTLLFSPVVLHYPSMCLLSPMIVAVTELHCTTSYPATTLQRASQRSW
jgi:hypothetical protein